MLQLAHATGVLLGLAFRFGVSCRCQLPRTFRDVLSMSDVSGALTTARRPRVASGASLPRQFTVVAAWALRHGLTAVFPEAAWNLLRPSAVVAMLTGGLSCFCPEILRREALYDGGVYPEDPHVQLFWIALNELPPAQVLRLLRKLWAHVALPGEAFYLPCPSNSRAATSGLASSTTTQSHTALPAPLRILQPTAVAMLSPDSADITIFAEKCAISIPRFSNLDIMTSKLTLLLV